MDTDIKHPVPDQVKPSLVIFDIWALWRSAVSVREEEKDAYWYQFDPQSENSSRETHYAT